MSSPSELVPCQLSFLQTELAAEMYVDELLDGQGRSLYLDRVSRVTALTEAETDAEYDPEHVKFNEVFVDP